MIGRLSQFTVLVTECPRRFTACYAEKEEKTGRVLLVELVSFKSVQEANTYLWLARELCRRFSNEDSLIRCALQLSKNVERPRPATAEERWFLNCAASAWERLDAPDAQQQAVNG